MYDLTSTRNDMVMVIIKKNNYLIKTTPVLASGLLSSKVKSKLTYKITFLPD